MTTRSTHRGHPIELTENGIWRYLDGTSVSDDHNRQCGHCNLPNRPDGHDACLGELPRVRNACCGHGDPEAAYVQYAEGDRFAYLVDSPPGTLAGDLAELERSIEKLCRDAPIIGFMYKAIQRASRVIDLGQRIVGGNRMITKPDGTAYHPGVKLLANVTRLEVIDDTGRALTYPVGEPMEVELSFQDDDRTLKVFVRGRGHDHGPHKWQNLQHSVSNVLARMKWDLSRTPEGTKEHELLTLYTRALEFALDPKAMG